MPNDPTPFTQYGVMGLLGFVIIALIGVIWKLFLKQDQSMAARDTVLMDFVNKHRAETSLAMQNVANTVANSHDKLASTLSLGLSELKTSTERHTRVLDKVLMTNSIFEQIERLKQKGTELSVDEIDKLVRSIIQEKTFRGE